jgi:hypothetical protein
VYGQEAARKIRDEGAEFLLLFWRHRERGRQSRARKSVRIVIGRRTGSRQWIPGLDHRNECCERAKEVRVSAVDAGAGARREGLSCALRGLRKKGRPVRAFGVEDPLDTSLVEEHVCDARRGEEYGGTPLEPAARDRLA